MAKQRPLTPKQQRFVEEYLIDLNATAAAGRAGYKGKNLGDQGSQLLSKTQIAAAIAAAQAERSHRTQITADEVLRELADLARSNVDHYQIDELGNLTLAPGAPERAMQAVASVKKKIMHCGEGRVQYTTELRLWSKPAALKMAAEHLGLLKKRVEHTGAGGGPIEGKVTHDVGSELAPYAGAIRGFLESLSARGDGAGGGQVPQDGPGQPVHPAQAPPQAGAVPPA